MILDAFNNLACIILFHKFYLYDFIICLINFHSYNQNMHCLPLNSIVASGKVYFGSAILTIHSFSSYGFKIFNFKPNILKGFDLRIQVKMRLSYFH